MINFEDLNNSAVENLFSERKDFIIIGLTGRTGSGCSTIANLFTKTFEELNPPIPESTKSIEERQYSIVYNYCNSNWDRFKKIEMKHIILTFILENSFESLIEFIESKFDIKLVSGNKVNEFKEEYDQLHKLRLKYKNDGEVVDKKGEAVLIDRIYYQFYFEAIPAFYKKFQELLYDTNCYTKIMQVIGNNIRASGQAFSNEIEPKNIFNLSQRVNMMIKMLRRENKIKTPKERVLVVIDSFRNPFEATFFKDRYSSFYLFSLNSTEEDRYRNLANKGFTTDMISELDNIEYPKGRDSKYAFYNINIGKTIELADVHLNNKLNDNDFSFIKRQIIRYVSLIMHPGIVSPTNIEKCMQIAFNAKLNSGCLSRQVGAVLTDSEFTINAIGWNSAPFNQMPCNLRDVQSLIAEKNTDILGMSEFERGNQNFRKYIKRQLSKINFSKLHGRTCSYCFKDAYNSYTNKDNQVYTRSIHAEEMAFLQAARSGCVSVKGGYLFTTASPCELCSKKACHIGIKKIYYIDPYPGISNEHIIMCGESHPEMELFQGAVGSAFSQFYTQIISYKDELYMLLNLGFSSEI